ncbi:ScbR family autoregulator-binding transcription factor [Streptomyces sp. NPDC048566]|uniref:ScbR family autoregulator-binding transcription factor n=1 Tax=Streptomyces sp. NPDC048566 TaxID=3365569 RepID=UPI0037222357
MKQQRAVRTRDALIRAAAETFERRGYVQAKLADISAGAGVSAGALHFHFPNKAAVASTVEAFAGAALRRAVQDAQASGMNALQRLTAASHAIARELQDDVVVRAGFHLSCRPQHRTGPDLREEWHTRVRRLLAEAEEEGLLAEHLRADDIAVAVTAATTGIEALAGADPQWLSPTSLTRVWDFLLPCMARPEALASLRAANSSTAGVPRTA